MIKKLCLGIILLLLFFCAYGEIGNSFSFNIYNEYQYFLINEDNPHNRDNWLGLPDWKDFSFFSVQWELYLSEWLSFSIKPALYFFLLDSSVSPDRVVYVFQPANDRYYNFRLDECKFTFSMFDGSVILEAGKFFAEYGTGYIWKPTNFLFNYTGERAKLMARLSCYLENFSLDLIYAPNRDFLPDDYRDFDYITGAEDFVFCNFNTFLDIHNFNVSYFHGDGSNHFGLSFSSQIGDNIIPYAEAVYVLNDSRSRISRDGEYLYSFDSADISYFLVSGGINYTPEIINWSFYLELFYNGRGFEEAYLKDYAAYMEEINAYTGACEALKKSYLGDALSTFDYARMSPFYAGIHIRQNDQFFDRIQLSDTVFISYPFGILNSFDATVNIIDNFNFSLNVFSVVYAAGHSEYGYYQNRHTFKAKLSYSYHMQEK